MDVSKFDAITNPSTRTGVCVHATLVRIPVLQQSTLKHQQPDRLIDRIKEGTLIVSETVVREAWIELLFSMQALQKLSFAAVASKCSLVSLETLAPAGCICHSSLRQYASDIKVRFRGKIVEVMQGCDTQGSVLSLYRR